MNHTLRPRWMRPLVLSLVLAGHGALAAALWRGHAPTGAAPRRGIAVALVMAGPVSVASKASAAPRRISPVKSAHSAPAAKAAKVPLRAIARAEGAPAGFALAQAKADVGGAPANTLSLTGGHDADNAPPQQSAAPSAGGGKPDYGTLVALALDRRKRYPPAARSAHETGSVRFAYVVNAAGRFASARLVQSSGHAALDDAAAQLFDEVRLPPPPAGLFRSVVTIHYALIEH